MKTRRRSANHSNPAKSPGAAGGKAAPSGRTAHDGGSHYVPMVYVLDARGIIRAKDVRGKAIDVVVDQLVKQIETRSGNSD